MLTTNKIKVKERSQKDVKLNMVTTGETKPKDFKLKGKGKPRPDVIITTSNVGDYQKIRNKDMVRESRDAKVRQKKLNEELRIQRNTMEAKRNKEILKREEKK